MQFIFYFLIQPTTHTMSINDGFQAFGDAGNYFSSQQSTTGFMSLLASVGKDVPIDEF